MALRKKTLAIPLTGPLERRNGGEDLTANLTALPAIPRALNVYRSRTGEWKRRPGHTLIDTSATYSSRAMGDFVAGASCGGQMRMFGRAIQWVKSDQNDADWSPRILTDDCYFGSRLSLFSPAQVPDFQRTTSATQFTECAVGGGVILNCALESDGSFFSSSVVVSASRVSDHSPIAEPFAGGWVNSGGSTLGRAHVLYSSVQGRFVVMWTTPNAPSTAATALKIAVFSPTGLLSGADNVAPIMAAATAVVSDLIGTATSVNAHFDAIVEEDTGDILVAYRSTTPGVKAFRYRPSTGAVVTAAVSVVGTDVAANGLCWARATEWPQASYRLYTAVNSATGVVERTLNKTPLTLASSITLMASPGNVGAITAHIPGTGAATRLCHWDVINADPSRSAIWMNSFTGGSWNTAVEVNGGASLRLYGHAFPYDSQSGFLVGDAWAIPTAGAITNAGKLTFFPAHYSDFINPLLEALDGKMDETSAPAGHLGNVAIYSGEFYFGCVERLGRRGDASLAATSAFSYAKNARIIRLSPGTRANPMSLDPDTVLIPGASWGRADGTFFSRAPWPSAAAPPITSITQFTHGSGLLTPGDFYYATALVTIDPSGRRWIGAPSVPVKATLVGPNNSFTYIFSESPTRANGCVNLEIYRTKVNSTQWFRDTSYDNDANSVGSGSLVTTDVIADSVLETGLPLYTDSGELLHVPPPPSHIAWIAGQRILCVDAQSPSRVLASSEFTPGEGPWFHPDMGISVPGGEEVVAGAFMDGRSFLFTRKSIFTLAGPWPGRTGAGNLPEVQRVATGVGGYSMESTVVTAEGIWFYSEDRGQCLLTRGLSVTQAGKIVDGVITSTPVAAIQVEKYDQVRLYQSDGVVAVYDQVERQWSHWQIASAALGGETVRGAFVHNRDVYVFTATKLFKEDAAALNDAGTAFEVATDLRIPIGPPGGKARIYRAILAGLCYGDTTLTCTLFNDFGNVGSGEETKTMVIKARPGEASPGMYEQTIKPRRGRCDSMLLRLSFQSTDPGITFRSLAIEVGGYQPATVARAGSGRQA